MVGKTIQPPSKFDIPVKASGVFRWRIDKWAEVSQQQTLYSDYFELGGYRWRVSVWPRGNKAERAGHVAYYLETEKDAGNPKWARLGHFVIALTHPHDEGIYVARGAVPPPPSD